VVLDGDLVRLNLERLTFEQRSELEGLCKRRMSEFLASRGIAVWDFDLIETEPVPESVRYAVLSRANGKCALCGKSKNEEPLEVDRIVPHRGAAATGWTTFKPCAGLATGASQIATTPISETRDCLGGVAF
jgi:hypothetical protein